MRGYMFEIESEKKEELEEYAENILRYGGKLMQCLDEMFKDDESMDSRMGKRMGYRRGVKGTGRFGMREDFREPFDDDNREPSRGYMGYRDPYYK